MWWPVKRNSMNYKSRRSDGNWYVLRTISSPFFEDEWLVFRQTFFLRPSDSCGFHQKGMLSEVLWRACNHSFFLPKFDIRLDRNETSAGGLAWTMEVKGSQFTHLKRNATDHLPLTAETSFMNEKCHHRKHTGVNSSKMLITKTWKWNFFFLWFTVDRCVVLRWWSKNGKWCPL